MTDELKDLLNHLENKIQNKEILKQCLKDYDCFLYNKHYPKTLGLEELWELLNSKDKNANSIYLIKKDYKTPIRLYCDEIKTETSQEGDDVILKYTMPYWWADFKVKL